MHKSTVAQINATCGVGSTGKIAVSISKMLTERSVDNYILCGAKTNGYVKGIPCCSQTYTKLQALKSRILGNWGFNSQAETRRIIMEIERFSPDTVLLHNLHGHDCDLSMLFTCFKEKQTKLFWTFHDCWAFTAYCPHFTLSKCEMWKTGCRHCPQRKTFSWFLDRSKTLYQRKKELFSGLNLTIITPSVWLADIVKQSFLKEYPVEVIHNGIDLNVFKPKESDFRQRCHIADNQFVLLGVAFGWGVRKGLDDFVELAKRLDPDKYRIVLVGTDEVTDKLLPKNIISVRRTQNQQELAQIYTAADVFVNPTREEVLGLVNLEALACGTPVVTFNTGGSPECIDNTCGSVTPVDDVDALEREIMRICESKCFPHEACIRRAAQFDQNVRFQEYVRLLLRE